MEAINTISEIERISQIDSNTYYRREKVYKSRFNPYTLSDNDFKYKYRFAKPTTQFILMLVSDDLKKDRRGGGISPELQLLTALRCWGRAEVQDDSGDLHGLSQPTVSRICCSVAHALARQANNFIKMPSSVREEESGMHDFQGISGFPGVIGAIDCTHVKIKRTGGDLAQYYINRKGFYSLNIQVICDAKLCIRDIVVRWRGSTHDSRIFAESAVKQRFDNGQFRGRLLGDSGYPLLPYLFTPILRPSTELEERYNRSHIHTRNTVERCFGVWKQRFRCLLHGMTVSLDNVKTVIVALAVLHNIAMTRNNTFTEQGLTTARVREPQPRDNEDVPRTAARRHARFVLNNFINNNF